MRKSLKLILPVLVVVILLISTNIALADLKATSAVYAWDRSARQFQNSNVIIYWDGGWVQFLHELGFDNDLYTPTACSSTPGYPGTVYAGIMNFGLYNTDNSPLGAPGFQDTRIWQVVDCDRNADGKFDNKDLDFQSGFTQYVSLTPISEDIVTDCSTGNCQDEIVTTLEVNLDEDCDGNRDSRFPENVCFFAEAQVPLVGSGTLWQGPLQARVTAGGGDKTVNFSVRGPNAILLEKFGVRSGSPWAGVVLLILVPLAVIPLAWLALRRQRQNRHVKN